MSTKPCGNCSKTVYLNEKITAEGKWYHKGCFRCMAPDCNISLTLRTFQVAALDESAIDPLTERPNKVLVCREHVPMPKSSLNADSLSIKHTTSVPKPSIPGLHRSMMGERGLENNEEVVGSNSDRLGSPRSLDQGSHNELLNRLPGSRSEGFLPSKGQTDEWNVEKEVDQEIKKPEPAVITMPTTVHSMFRNGRISNTIDPISATHVAAEEAQSPIKDDDSFRNIPVRPRDYGYQDGDASKEKEEDSDSWDDSVDEEEEFTRPPALGSKQQTANATAVGDELMNKFGNMSFGSKMNRDTEDNDNDQAVDDDEWDTAPVDDISRRETIAGI
ncbi:hypothetical protein BGZ76_011408 [Entomortierella beljakovae]|nr:hypothetical protein BGZ76_011408 [Entomortierella beljakovae]